MRENRLQQIAGPAIVQEEPSLPNTPKRSSPEHVSLGQALRDTIRQAGSHVMSQQVREKIYRPILERLRFKLGRREHLRRVTQETANPRVAHPGAKQLLPANSARREWHGLRSIEEPHHQGEHVALLPVVRVPS